MVVGSFPDNCLCLETMSKESLLSGRPPLLPCLSEASVPMSFSFGDLSSASGSASSLPWFRVPGGEGTGNRQYLQICFSTGDSDIHGSLNRVASLLEAPFLL